jgi:hypothetical protein
MSYTVSGITYPSRYAYDKARALSSGYTSVRQFRADRSAEVAIERLSSSGKQTYDRALQAVSRMREGKSLTDAAKEAGTTPKSVLKYAGSALNSQNNRYTVKAEDNLTRRLLVPYSNGSEYETIRSSKDATLLSRYWSAVKEWRNTGDASVLQSFEGKTITVKGQQVKLITDPEQLALLQRGGELDFIDMYERSLL